MIQFKYFFLFFTLNFFLKPKIINQKILAIDFNQEGFITNIQDFENKNLSKTDIEVDAGAGVDDAFDNLFANLGR